MLKQKTPWVFQSVFLYFKIDCVISSLTALTVLINQFGNVAIGIYQNGVVGIVHNKA